MSNDLYPKLVGLTVAQVAGDEYDQWVEVTFTNGQTWMVQKTGDGLSELLYEKRRAA